MLSLIKKELRINRKSIIIWILASGAFMASGLIKSQGIAAGGGTTDLNAIMDNFPPVMQSLYGMNGLDMTTFEGYFGVMTFFSFIILGIHAITTSFKMFAIEEIDHTYEYIYTKPISKRSIVTSKVIATIILAALLNIGLLICTLLSVASDGSGELHLKFIVENHLHIMLVQMFFIGLSYMMIGLTNKAEGSSKFGVIILFAFYLLSVISGLSDGTAFLAAFTPFRFLEIGRIITGDVTVWAYILPIAIFIIGISIVVTLKPRQELKA